MNAFVRPFRFAVFTLIEYGRSGRILVEAIGLAVAYYMLFRAWTSAMQADYFFSTANLLSVVQTFYTTTALLGLGDRANGYLLLMRRLGRSGYILGLYLAAILISFASYGLISLMVALTNPVANLTLNEWLLGSIPLLLNCSLLAALLTLLSPLVLSVGWRLTMLAFLAIAFSGNLIGGPTLQSIGEPWVALIRVFQTLFGAPLLPAFTGFSLSVTRDYGGYNVLIPVSQFLLTLSMLSLALFAFRRRELILSGN
jgi:uncharacterized membrane protein